MERLTGDLIATEEPLSEQRRRGRLFLRTYAAAVTLATVGFFALAFSVRDQDMLTHFDAPVAQAIQGVHAPVLSWVLINTSELGWFPYDVICYALIVGALLTLRLRLEAFAVLASTLVAGGVGTLVKDLVQRQRPTASFVHIASYIGDYSFPSGHVIFATVLFGVTFWVVWVAWGRSLLRNTVLVALAALILLMGVSRVYTGEHWPSDVLGAYLLSGLWVAGTIELIMAVKPHLNGWWRGRPHRLRWLPN